MNSGVRPPGSVKYSIELTTHRATGKTYVVLGEEVRQMVSEGRGNLLQVIAGGRERNNRLGPQIATHQGRRMAEGRPRFGVPGSRARGAVLASQQPATRRGAHTVLVSARTWASSSARSAVLTC